MIRRSYPLRKKGQLQASPVKSVRLSLPAQEGLALLMVEMEKKWNKQRLPSMSHILSKALERYAESVAHNPRMLQKAYQEFLDDSRTRSANDEGKG